MGAGTIDEAQHLFEEGYIDDAAAALRQIRDQALAGDDHRAVLAIDDVISQMRALISGRILVEFDHALSESTPDGGAEPTVAQPFPWRAWVMSLFGAGSTAAVVMTVILFTAPCDRSAPLMSLDRNHLMPDPYRSLALGMNIISPILLGLAAGTAGRQRSALERVLVALSVWFFVGLGLFVFSGIAYRCHG